LVDSIILQHLLNILLEKLVPISQKSSGRGQGLVSCEWLGLPQGSRMILSSVRTAQHVKQVQNRTPCGTEKKTTLFSRRVASLFPQTCIFGYSYF